MDIALATYSAAPQLDADDQLLLPALARRGLKGVPCVWDDARVEWSRARLVVIRSTWDSHLRRDAFLAWAERTAAQTRVLNPPQVLRWNTHKAYLRELAAVGVPVTPTAWVSALDRPSLAALAKERGWTSVVVKPAVSAGARATHRIADALAPEAQALFGSLAEHGELMIQPYLESFEREGERSYLFFDGHFSHAVRRPPGLKDTPHAFTEPHRFAPLPDELTLARGVLDASPGPLLYARVDVATDASGRPCLQELEATEPSLFLGRDATAADRLAEAIVRQL